MPADLRVREVIDRGVNRIGEVLQDQPLIHARLFATMGDVYWSLGLFDRSRALFESALKLRLKHLHEPDRDIADSYFRLGASLTFPVAA